MYSINYDEFKYFFYTSLYASCCVFLISVMKDVSYLAYIMCNSYYDSDLEMVILYPETEDKDQAKEDQKKILEGSEKEKEEKEGDVKKKLAIKYEDKYIPEWNRMISNHNNNNNNNNNPDKDKELHVAKHAYLLELCPLGNVCIFFNDDLECFEYYSDFTIPFRFLETIGRKYAIVYKCPDIYIDMKMEIDKAIQYSKEEKVKAQIKQAEEKAKQSEEKSVNVFANFKSYNGSTKKSDVPMTKGRSQNALQIPDSLKRKFKSSINEEELSVLKERSNHYLYKGKLSNFNWLQKPPNKRENVSYKDFIKAQQSNKY